MAIQFKNLVDVFEQRTGATATDAYTLTVSTEQTSGATPNPGTGGLKVQYYSVSSGTTHGFGLVAGSSSSDFLTSGPMHFYTNSDLDTKNATGLAMILDTSQNLGIGVTSITAGNRLEVAGGTIGIDDYLVHNGDTNTKFGFVANDNFAITTAGSERIRVTSGGNLGVGTNNPVNKLDVAGDIGVDEYIVHNGDTNTKFGFSSAGVVTFGADPANPTWYLDLVNKKTGFRTTTPGSAFDVNGTFRARNELNVGATSEQNLFVEGGSGPRYVKMGAYTPSNKDTWLTGASNANLVRGTAGFGTGGKILMATYRYTTKIEPGGWPTSGGSNNGVNITPTPSSGQVMIVKGIFVHKAGSTIGSGWSTSTYPVIFTQQTNAGSYAYVGAVSRTVIINGSGAWFYNALGYGENGFQQGGSGRPVQLFLNAAPITNEPTWYITVEYSIINLNVYRQNVDQTLT